MLRSAAARRPQSTRRRRPGPIARRGRRRRRPMDWKELASARRPAAGRCLQFYQVRDREDHPIQPGDAAAGRADTQDKRGRRVARGTAEVRAGELGAPPPSLRPTSKRPVMQAWGRLCPTADETMADGDAGTQRNENTGPLVRSGSLLTPAGLRLLSSRPARACVHAWSRVDQI